MIEFIAEGPVRAEKDERIDRTDGHDPIYGRVTTVEQTTVRIDLEFEQGYVNLEGYAPSSPGIGLEWAVDRYIPDGFEIDDAREWSVRLEGETFDWIQQAHRYQTERPDRSIVGCLSLFKGWDETYSDTLERAIEEVKRVTGYATSPMGELSDSEYRELRERLNTIDNVRIPESYRE